VLLLGILPLREIGLGLTSTLLVGLVGRDETTDMPPLIVLSIELGMLDVRDILLLGVLLGEVLETTDVPPLILLSSGLGMLDVRVIFLSGGLSGKVLETTDVPSLLLLGSVLAMLALRRMVLLGGFVGAIFVLVVVLQGDETT
jgi:hypothetical protein